MLNDRDDRHDDHEESEYHFSDEDISFEADAESPKSASTGGTRESLGSRLAKSKRMIISIGVFSVLVFIVYKMVAPTSSVPSEISAPIVAAKPKAMPAPAPVAQVAQAPTEVVPQAPVMQVQVQPPAPTPTPTNQMQAQQIPAPAAPAPMANQPLANQAPTNQPIMNQAQPVSMQNNQQPLNQPQPAAMSQQQAQAVVSMPSMIPVPPPPAPEAMPISSSPTVTIVQSPYQNQSWMQNWSLEANNQKLMSKCSRIIRKN